MKVDVGGGMMVRVEVRVRGAAYVSKARSVIVVKTVKDTFMAKVGRWKIRPCSVRRKGKAEGEKIL